MTSSNTSGDPVYALKKVNNLFMEHELVMMKQGENGKANIFLDNSVRHYPTGIELECTALSHRHWVRAYGTIPPALS